MPLERRTIEASLEKKGFVSANGDHSFFVYRTVSGLTTSVFTKTSHGSGHKTISDELVSRMAKQCGLNTGQFKKLVECPLSRENYEAILVEAKRIRI
jgi:hypothetical protein